MSDLPALLEAPFVVWKGKMQRLLSAIGFFFWYVATFFTFVSVDIGSS